MAVSNRELQALEIIHRYGGQVGYSTVAQVMHIGTEYARTICAGLGRADYINLYASGLCVITPKGRNELIARGLLQPSDVEDKEGMVEDPNIEAPPTPAMREPLLLEERVLGHIVSWPGIRCGDIEILFDLSKVEAEERLQGLVKKGKLHLNGELYYPASTAADHEGSLARGVLADQGDDSLELQSVPKGSR